MHLNKLNFIRFLVPLFYKTLKTSGKAMILNLKGDAHLMKYAYAKRKGFSYFFKWVVVKNTNTGEMSDRLTN